VQLRWNAVSGELGYGLTAARGAGIPVCARTLAVARALARHPAADVVLAPDGNLFVADARAGAVWLVRRTAPRLNARDCAR